MNDTAFYFSSKTLKKYTQKNLEAEYWPFESFEPNIFFVLIKGSHQTRNAGCSNKVLAVYSYYQTLLSM